MNGAFFLRPGVWLMRRLHLGGKLLLLGAVAGGLVLSLVWLAGAALLAVVVVKLFTIELTDHGSLYRIE